jgi:hypothetical protein
MSRKSLILGSLRKSVSSNNRSILSGLVESCTLLIRLRLAKIHGSGIVGAKRRLRLQGGYLGTWMDLIWAAIRSGPVASLECEEHGNCVFSKNYRTNYLRPLSKENWGSRRTWKSVLDCSSCWKACLKKTRKSGSRTKNSKKQSQRSELYDLPIKKAQE